MRRLAAAVLAATALLAFTAVPTQAQDIADLPRLGYEIDPTRGFVGDEVHSDVNVDDLREHCWSQSTIFSDTTDVQVALDSYIIDYIMYWAPGDTLEILQLLPLFDPGRAEFWESLRVAIIDRWGFFPPGENPGVQIVEAVAGGPIPEGIPDDAEGAAFVERVTFALITTSNLLAVEEFIAAIYPQVHVTTFVDPPTQEMLGEMGEFNPETGQGVMPVPDLDPDLYAVAAACAFMLPYSEMAAALPGALVAAWNWSVDNNMFPTSTAPAGWQPWAEAGGFGALLSGLVEPIAVGIDFYCILDEDGLCAIPPEPVGLVDDDIIEEFSGDPAPSGVADDDIITLQDMVDMVDVVDATPAFTG